MFELKFEMGGAAFEGDPTTEVARVLVNTAHRIAAGEPEGIVRDVNGNTIGTYQMDGHEG